jgi:hypothetical protein
LQLLQHPRDDCLFRAVFGAELKTVIDEELAYDNTARRSVA